jgi:uncharacterized membrane protein
MSHSHPSSTVVVPTPRGRNILLLVLLAAGLFFAVSAFRHAIYRSGGLDLGFFDQAVYLISVGQPPINSFFNFHVLSDHAAVILYPIALVYKIWPSVYALLLIQSVVLASGAWPVARLARAIGLTSGQSMAMAGTYLMYPVVLTVNIYDWHPEIFAVPGLLWALVAAREDRKILFAAAILLTLACKEVLALTVIAMGLWLLVFERRRFFGAFAVAAGATWFIVAAQVIIPYFAAGKQPSGLVFYHYLGTSLPEVATNLFLNPQLAVERLASKDGVKYLAVLLVPLAWGLNWRTMSPLLAAVPCVALNLLADNPQSRSPFFQYSIPVIPFLFLSVMLAIRSGRSWLASRRAIVTWSVALLVVGGLARGKRLLAGESADWDSLGATRSAVAIVAGDHVGDVLTTHECAPHLTQRAWLQTVCAYIPWQGLDEFEYVLLNADHASVKTFPERFALILSEVKSNRHFELVYHDRDVYLFKHRNPNLADVSERPTEPWKGIEGFKQAGKFVSAQD